MRGGRRRRARLTRLQEGLAKVVSRLLALLLCHRVTQDDDGRPVLQGLYDRVALRTVPGVDECVVYTKYAAAPGEHELVLAIVHLDSGRETGRATHRVTIAPGRAAHETTWSISARYESAGRYLYRFSIDGEMIGFTTVDVVGFGLV
jgi:hypothetical protein